MHRHELTDTAWKQLPPWLPPHQPTTGRPATAHRGILNGILGLLRTGAPGRDLPARSGPWSTVARRCSRGRKAGLGERLFAAVQPQADANGPLAWDLHDGEGTLVRAHQQAAGAKKGRQPPPHSAA